MLANTHVHAVFHFSTYPYIYNINWPRVLILMFIFIDAFIFRLCRRFLKRPYFNLTFGTGHHKPSHNKHISYHNHYRLDLFSNISFMLVVRCFIRFIHSFGRFHSFALPPVTVYTCIIHFFFMLWCDFRFSTTITYVRILYIFC